MSKSKIIVGLTGSIACFKTCSLISQLVKSGHDVQVIASPSALNFVGEATLEGLTGRKVLSDVFSRGHMMDHIYLARWADKFIVAPITANHINKFAHGLADDMLTTLYLALDKTKTVYLAPAMNSVMHSHFTVQESLEKLKAHGAKILEPNHGILACGENGIGKMMEPDEIFNILTVDKVSQTVESKGEILITFGGTCEYIDGVRAITNLSTGHTGSQLAEHLSRNNFKVTAMAAKTAVKPTHVHRLLEFTDHHSLQTQLKQLLEYNNYCAVIHLAAVSDFTVDKIISGDTELSPEAVSKLESDKPLTIKLIPTTKIVRELKSYSRNKNIRVIAFKLTNSTNTEIRLNAVNALLGSRDVDLVVHNDLHDIRRENGSHIFSIYSPNSAAGFRVSNTSQLAEQLDQFISAQIISANSFNIYSETPNDLMS